MLKKFSEKQKISDQFIIRDYNCDDDFPEVESLWKETGIAGEERGDSPDSIRRCIQHGGRFLVLVDRQKNRLAGTSWLTFDGRRLHLHHFAIKPMYQNKKLGKRLGLATLEYIKETGYQVKLEVHKENHIAKKFYKKLGFFAFEDYDIFMIRNTNKIVVDKSGG